MSKKRNTVRKSLRKESETEFSTTLRYLPTSSCSLSKDSQTHTAIVSMWLALVSPASPSQSQENEKARTMSETSGPKQWNVFVEYDQFSHSWKTFQGCLALGISDEFSENWPKAGTMRSGQCWEQTKSEPIIAENVYGFWPTPDTGARGARSAERMKRIYGHKINLVDAAKHWDTPTQRDYKGSTKKNILAGNPKFHLGGAIGGPLNPSWVEWLMGWPTGWTELKPLETDKFQSKWLTLFQNYLKGLIYDD